MVQQWMSPDCWRWASASWLGVPAALIPVAACSDWWQGSPFSVSIVFPSFPKNPLGSSVARDILGEPHFFLRGNHRRQMAPMWYCFKPAKIKMPPETKASQGILLPHCILPNEMTPNRISSIAFHYFPREDSSNIWKILDSGVEAAP